MEIQGSPADSKQVTKPTSYTLKEFVDAESEISRQINEGVASDDIYDLQRAARALVAGKVDAIGNYRLAISARIKACKDQISYLEDLSERVDEFVTEAVKASPGGKIVGNIFTAKLKKNPPQVLVLSEGAVPLEYKNIDIDLSCKFPCTDSERYNLFRDFILQRSVTAEAPMTEDESKKLAEHVTISLDKRKMSKEMKAGTIIDGAMLNQGESVSFTAGKTAPLLEE